MNEYNERFEDHDRGAKQRNPLKSLTENSFSEYAFGANNGNRKEPRNSRERLDRRERSDRRDDRRRDGRMEEEVGRNSNQSSSNYASSSSKKHKVPKNPYEKSSKSNSNEPTFAYQEVVRGRANREALPGYDCEECRKFLNAIGDGYDRDQIIQQCSRHRSRHAPPSTPDGFWNLTFIDSVGKKSLSGGSNSP